MLISIFIAAVVATRNFGLIESVKLTKRQQENMELAKKFIIILVNLSLIDSS